MVRGSLHMRTSNMVNNTNMMHMREVLNIYMHVLFDLSLAVQTCRVWLYGETD